jgi:hypothetical protein
MNWKFLLFAIAAVSGVKAQEMCPSSNPQGCPNPSTTNFIYNNHGAYWCWDSGTVPDVSICNSGIITFTMPDAKFPINGICIQWDDWSYTYVTRGSQQSCELESFTKGIANAWGY